MKKYINFIYVITLLFSVFTACDREKLDYGLDGENPVVEGEGKAEFSFKLNVDEVEQTRASDINTNDYIITLYNPNGQAVKSSKKIDFPETMELLVGKYTLEAKSTASLGMEQPSSDPYYAGAQEFEIKKGETTSISTIRCTLKNIKVEMLVHESLADVLDEYQVTATFIAGDASLTFSYTNLDNTDKFIFFPAINENNVLVVELQGKSGSKDVYLGKTYIEVQAGEYRRITFTYTGNTPGADANINLNIDANCEIVNKNITVPGIDNGGTDPEPEPEPEPGDGDITIEGDGFDIDGTVLLEYEGEVFEDVIVNITAPNGIKDLFVEIVSAILTPEELGNIGMAAEFNLAQPGELEEILGILGFPVGNDVIGKTFLPFDISEFIPLVASLGTGVSEFVVTAVDQEGGTLTKTLTLEVVE